MKIKHYLMLIATLFFPTACNNKDNNQNNDTVQKLETSEELIPNNNIDNSKNGTTRLSYAVSGGESNITEKEYTIDSPDNDLTFDSITIREPELISTYTTKVYTKTNARVKNLEIVANKINNYILGPGEEFSYNKTCGPYSKEQGFGKATIFVGKKDVQEYGGGVCQVSSTLYNAVKGCNIEILERHNHSKDVYYVPKNEDATVSYSSGLDFKFKNLNDYSLKITATSSKDNVTVSIYKV